MSWFTGVVLYCLIWTLTLFIVLPFGIEHDPNPNPNPAENSPGAPVAHNMKKKCAVTFFIAAFLWIILFVLIKVDLIDFRGMAMAMMEQDKVK